MLEGVEGAESAEIGKRFCVEVFVLSLLHRAESVEVVEVVAQKRGHNLLSAKKSIHGHAHTRGRTDKRTNSPI